MAATSVVLVNSLHFLNLRAVIGGQLVTSATVEGGRTPTSTSASTAYLIPAHLAFGHSDSCRQKKAHPHPLPFRLLHDNISMGAPAGCLLSFFTNIDAESSEVRAREVRSLQALA